MLLALIPDYVSLYQLLFFPPFFALPLFLLSFSFSLSLSSSLALSFYLFPDFARPYPSITLSFLFPSCFPPPSSLFSFLSHFLRSLPSLSPLLSLLLFFPPFLDAPILPSSPNLTLFSDIPFCRRFVSPSYPFSLLLFALPFLIFSISTSLSPFCVPCASDMPPMLPRL